MEEEVIKEKKKGEEKRKLVYTVGESSRPTKRGTGRSFSAGGENFSRGSPAFRGSSGPRFSGPMGFNKGSIEGSSFTIPSIGSGREAGQSYSRGPAFAPSCSTCGRRHLGHCWGPDATPKIVITAESSIESSGRRAERGRGRGRGTGNKDVDHTIGGGLRGSGSQVTQGQTQARIYKMTREEAPASNDVISGTILLFDVETYVLIDPGSTHSYISSELASKIPSENSPLGYNLTVYLPVGGGVIVNSVRKGSLVRIGDVTFPVDLIVMDLKEFDVILGMDWLAQHRAVVDCYKKEVMMNLQASQK
ncbi:UNVERIFIED_CONTAM: hypothetical protein Slati_4467900 [Sesamum latifolium]|uniref:Gag-pol polyprotein n=1 Tax=Sesamum latifolium TaxID=2727402 RepID=A0AAW2SS94_9LAMI